jgi:hypothetical protein
LSAGRTGGYHTSHDTIRTIVSAVARGTEAAMRTRLNPDALRVESFGTAEGDALRLEREVAGRTPLCSAMDLCATRPC